MTANTASSGTVHNRLESRVLKEGYGPGAWHGADLKAAIADVTPALAFRRPAEGRHNIAEIALHHAYTVHNVRGQLSGHAPEPFVMAGEDWFDLNDERALAWRQVQAIVEAEHDRLAGLVGDIEGGKATSPVSDDERLKLVLGITCHAIYHAGQIQLIKRLTNFA